MPSSTLPPTLLLFSIPELFPGRADGSRSAGEQGWFQIAALVTTLVIAIISGLIVGWIASCSFFYPPKKLFQDNEYWFVEGESEDEEEGDKKEEDTNGRIQLKSKNNASNLSRVDSV